MKFDRNNIISADHKTMRNINRLNVLNIIREKVPVSRVEIAKLTGLKKSTITSIVGELIEGNLVYEDSLGKSTVGRKPVNLRINERSQIVGVIDVQHGETTVALCDLGRNILEKKVIKTFKGDGEKFFSRCSVVLESMAGAYSEPLAGVGVSVPALVNYDQGLIYKKRTLEWENINVRDIIRRKLECQVFVENDGKAGALAELWFANEADGLSNFIFIWVCEGIGVGLVMNKSVYHGAYSLDGQFGQQLIKIDGKWEEFNQDNTWQENASDLGVIRRYKEYSGLKWEGKIKEIEQNMQEVIAQARKENPNAMRALRETARYLGVGIANINNGLSPERIIIAGGIVHVWDLVFPELVNQVELQTIFQLMPASELIIPSSLDSPTFAGAQAMVHNYVFGGHSSR